MEEVEIEFRRAADFSARFIPNGRLGGMVFEGQADHAVGTEVRLVVRFTEAMRVFHVRGRVAWSRFNPASLGPAWGVEFLSSEKAACDRLLSFANGQVPLETLRRDERVPLSIRVRVRLNGNDYTEHAVDVSAGGLFLPAEAFPPPVVGGEVEVTMRLPGSLRSLTLRGRVAWRRDHGAGRGVGIEFLYKDARERGRVESLVRKLVSSQSK